MFAERKLAGIHDVKGEIGRNSRGMRGMGPDYEVAVGVGDEKWAGLMESW